MLKKLLGILAGAGSTLNAFGTPPQYDIPRREIKPKTSP
jgi:hypothetical protein